MAHHCHTAALASLMILQVARPLWGLMPPLLLQRGQPRPGTLTKHVWKGYVPFVSRVYLSAAARVTPRLRQARPKQAPSEPFCSGRHGPSSIGSEPFVFVLAPSASPARLKDWRRESGRRRPQFFLTASQHRKPWNERWIGASCRPTGANRCAPCWRLQRWRLPSTVSMFLPARKKCSRFAYPLSEPENESPGALVGRSWGGIGRSWVRLGVLLGPSLWPSQVIGAIWRLPEPIRREKARMQEKTLRF